MFTRLEAAMLQGIALASLGIGCSGKVITTSDGGDGTATTGGTSASSGGGSATGGTGDGGAPATGGMASASGGNGTGGDTAPFDPESLPPLPTDREFPDQVGED